VNDQQEGIELSAKDLFLRADAVATGSVHENRSVQESFTTVQDLKLFTRKIVEDCIKLQDFFTVSRTFLLDSASKADEKLREGVNYSSLVHECMPKVHLNSSLVCVISDIYNALRQAEENILNQNNAGDASLWQAPSSFQRATTKYWVKDENLTKLMMTCAAEAPLLVYGKKGPLTSTERRDMNVSDGDKLWDSLATVITSIYFDSEDMSLYKERIVRAEGAQLLRARWYGTTMPTGDKIIFVELKTHHEKWVANKSVKERASIQERDMVNFLRPVRWKTVDAEQMIFRAKPKLKAEELPKAIDLLLRMHNLVVRHKLTACVRSVYDRAAFQSSTNNGE
jgi:SPX domain protein involved in polyphosphate accumulation